MERRLNCRFEIMGSDPSSDAGLEVRPALLNAALEFLLEDLGGRIAVAEVTTNIVRLVATDDVDEVCEMRLAFPFDKVTRVEEFQQAHAVVTVVLSCSGAFAVDSIHEAAIKSIREMCQRYQLSFEELFAKEQ